MMVRERIARWLAKSLTTVLVASALLASAYVGAYFWQLQTPRIYIGGSHSGTYLRLAFYRANSRSISRFFRPANWVDRHVRPGYWCPPVSAEDANNWDIAADVD